MRNKRRRKTRYARYPTRTRLGCGLVFSCRGFGGSAFAFGVGFGRSGRRRFRVVEVGARLGLVVAAVLFVLISGWFWALRGMCGGFVLPRSWCFLVLVVFLRLGFGLLRMRWFRMVFSLFGAAFW